MIVMINGTFGVGKSAVATALHQRLPHALVFDPEAVGHLVRYITEPVRFASENTGDFQDIGIWRTLTVATAAELYRQYQRPLIVPMTIVQPDYLDTIRTGFAGIAPVYHFCLVAPFAVIEQRLQERGDAPNSWAWHKSRHYVPQLHDQRYAQHVETANRSVAAIVDEILASIPHS